MSLDAKLAPQMFPRRWISQRGVQNMEYQRTLSLIERSIKAFS
uniref:Uncharacterized protein n=1 Tax=Moniliophthora roreri TaxID=221103 RepID=A0A0W0G086_MONRR